MGTRRDFRGKTVLISGAAGGIGRELAFRFGRAGARLALLDVDGNGLSRLSDELNRQDMDNLTLMTDLTDPEACENAVGRTLERFRSLDCLINNAGMSHRSLFANTDLTVIRRVVEVNLMGSIHLTKSALPALIQRQGLIMAVSTVVGFAPILGRCGYAASKHGLHGFFDTLRAELKSTGVEVSLVCPGFTATPLENSALGGDGLPVRQDKVTVGRVAAPDRVAEKIFRVAEKPQRMVVLTGIGKTTRFLSRFCPSLYQRMMIKRLGPEFY